MEFLNLLKLFLLIIFVFLAVAFFTLLERKFLSYIQKRKGPNKLGFKGLLQPFSDAIKLFTKEPMVLNMAYQFVYYLSPVAMLLISLLMWFTFPSVLGNFEISLSIIFILCCLSFSVYPILGASWASNSKYSMLGGLRAIAQTISYEVSFAIIILSLVTLNSSFNLTSFLHFYNQSLTTISPILAMMWFVSALAETNRTPFDFSESESELVSGFNTEYSASGFILFFLAEYSSMLFMSVLFSVLFIGAQDLYLKLIFWSLCLINLFIWVRGTLPRMRYDKLMSMAWKIFLPISISYLILFMSMKQLLN
uniref:NADH-ubiquinone oxidoreductase chain 1 n=1 Tax=Mongoloniscus sinensis TaxID=1783568 RepID=A0A3G3LKP4_9CRUS|nr:NADH dehydrogenase subunit 1 [Mongoloniscus sinensis]AYQ93285.1 NADH dehydrogenase subunit 1 [Mongoloniscus sinensis]